MKDKIIVIKGLSGLRYKIRRVSVLVESLDEYILDDIFSNTNNDEKKESRTKSKKNKFNIKFEKKKHANKINKNAKNRFFSM